MTPPKPLVLKANLSPFPPITSSHSINAGFRYGKGDNPPLLGQIQIPEGKSGCLQGNTFVVTGTMPSLTREKITELIEKYGGKVTTSVSGKTDVLVTGIIEVGPKKLSEAKSRNIPIIDENGLLQIIGRSNPDYKPPIIELPKEEIKVEIKKIEIPEKIINNEIFFLPLSIKYTPKEISDLLIPQGPRKQLKDFLNDFSKNKKKILLLSGPSGCGKTSFIHVICSSLGYNIQEYNSSHKRSKNEIEKFIDLINNKTLENNNNYIQSKLILLFDELEGMSSSDKGGISAIADLSLKTKHPIICITSDRNNKKLLPLEKNSIEINLLEIPSSQILQKLQQICILENLNISFEDLKNISQLCKGDIRFALNYLQFWSSKSQLNSNKDEGINDVITATTYLLSPNINLEIRFQASFIDNSINSYLEQNINIPLMNSKENLNNLNLAFDSISLGDILDTLILKENSWDLSTSSNFLSCVYPGILLHHNIQGETRINLPKSFNYLNKEKKILNNINLIYNNLFKNFNISKFEIYTNLSPLIFNISNNFFELNKFNDLLNFLNYYQLTLDDLINIFDLNNPLGKKTLDIKLNSKFIQLYKKNHSLPNKNDLNIEKRSSYFVKKN